LSRVRLDVLLAERALAESRERAQALILAGRVTVNGQPALKAGQLVAPDVALDVRQSEPYVSRGGYKLAHALDTFGLDVSGLVAVDIGASTGGFTDVLLQRGARRVYAVDVGRGQLHWRLQGDPRVVVLDRTNARHLTLLPEQPGVATVDVSFISLRLIIPPLRRLLAPRSFMIVLIKPQFEAGPRQVGRGGIVRSAEVHRSVLTSLAEWFQEQGLPLAGLVASPIRGAAGNREFLAWLSEDAPEGAGQDQLIERALASSSEVGPSPGPAR
jgi:23S rRNA (cytidine1920-2'-O)/16S rRNA (cytidine1409-2'-O)-methyltransferase